MIKVDSIPNLVNNAYVYGLDHSIIASGYPMLSEYDPAILHGEVNTFRAMKLGNTPIGSGHDNYLNGIVVQFDLTFTKQAWGEAERYHFLDFVSSMSLMHRLARMDIQKNCIKYVDDRIISVMTELQSEYLEDPTSERFLQLIYSCPVAIQLTARMTTNYRQLKTIYSQRIRHRLPEWREFCAWIEKLPMFKDLCLGDDSL